MTQRRRPRSVRKHGRPSTFTQAVADEVCRRLADGETLRAICRDPGIPGKATVMRWLAEQPEFRDQYARAREAQADYWADEILSIADDGTGDSWFDEQGHEHLNHDAVQRSKLRIETRKWLMARMAPKKYDDRITAKHTGKDGGLPMTRDVSTLTDQELVDIIERGRERRRGNA